METIRTECQSLSLLGGSTQLCWLCSCTLLKGKTAGRSGLPVGRAPSVPRSDFRTCPWSAPQSYESWPLPCQPLMLLLKATVLREMSRWPICGCSDDCKHVSHTMPGALSCPATPEQDCGRPLELRAWSLRAHLGRYKCLEKKWEYFFKNIFVYSFMSFTLVCNLV